MNQVSFAAGLGTVSPSAERNFVLGIPGFRYGDLYEPEKLATLDGLFREGLRGEDPRLADRFEAYRAGAQLEGPAESELLIAVARLLSPFVARLFGVESARSVLLATAQREAAIFRFKEFLVRRACKKFPQTSWPPGAESTARAGALREEVLQVSARAFPELVVVDDEELTICGALSALLEIEEPYGRLAEGQTTEPVPVEVSTRLETIVARLGGATALGEGIAPDLDGVRKLLGRFERFAAVHRFDPVAHASVSAWVSYRLPHALDYDQLVTLRRPDPTLPNVTEGPREHHRRRDGFRLTDQRMTRREVASEADYCLYCHDRQKDSCSSGMHDKQGAVKKNALGIPLNGCPLHEKISEMHVLRKGGDSLGALAMIIVDNPMVPGTGHRICNDCMKACVFQKQDPVNIPQSETGILTDVLQMPWGFEIYSFLTRWNPLNRRRPYALPYNGKNVMVVGMGPAGYTLAHHLVNEGFGVVGVEGLKIEPLPSDLVGGDVWPPRALRRSEELQSDLESRILRGFGGVAEYGITVRWDKNFLTMLYLTLARRPTFRVYGGVRFGGTLDVDDAFALGFDHIAMAAGAGRPTIIDMKNNLIRGVRKASDFLMALQLTGGFKKDSLANLQVRLPALVIGGGLTGIDTATELAAYYPVQVEKFLARWEALLADEGGPDGEALLTSIYDAEEAGIAREFIAHGRAVRAERARAAAAGEPPNLAALVDAWGGVALVYRRSLQDSPAYRLNHEEVSKFFEEGVRFIEKMSPVACWPDRFGALEAVEFEKLEGQGGGWTATGTTVKLPARSLFVAAGTQPNITYGYDRAGSFEIDPKAKSFRSFQAHRDGAGGVVLQPTPAGQVGFFTSLNRGGKLVSFYGDNNPAYAGSVVRAMASGKDGYPHVAALFAPELRGLRAQDQPARDAAWGALVAKLDDQLRPTVVRVDRLTPTIVEVVVRAPAAARKFQPGQFFRFQNYETSAPLFQLETAGLRASRLQMEGMALTGAWVDREKGLLSLIVLEMGGSSRLCASLVPGEQVVVMGPTGTPTEIPPHEAVLLCGGGLGNAVLFSIAKALRQQGSQVLYFAAYRSREDIYKVEEIEAGTDQVIWSVDAGELPEARRPQDRVFRGNIVEAMEAYARGALGEAKIPMSSCHRIIAIGSDRMMAAVQRARHTRLAPFLRREHVAIASINSPMQCMMKEICAQCLQKHVDPVTGKEVVVFSCSNQDQPQDQVDWKNLADRLRQNTVQEKLTDRWVRRILSHQRRSDDAVGVPPPTTG